MENTSLKITVVGVGGVGGLLAGVLLRHYGSAVSLIARGARAEHLRSKGLTLHSGKFGEFTVQPETITADPADLPVQDVILVCVKNDALKTVSEQIKPIVGENTMVLPVMNGVNPGSNLRSWLGKGTVLESVIYTVSSVNEDYSITQKGRFTQIYAGAQAGDAAAAEACKKLCGILEEAGIECHFSEDVQAAIWSKYVLNCAYNVATARWGIDIGTIQNNARLRADYQALMEEAYRTGLAAGVNLPDDMIAGHMRRLDKTTPDSTSSLSRDFDIKKSGEMEVFSGEVVRMAEQYGVDAPVSREYYEGLKRRAANDFVPDALPE